MKISTLMCRCTIAATMILCAFGMSAKDVTLNGFTYTAEGEKENKKIQVTYALNGTDKIARVKKVVDNNFPQKKSCWIPRSIKVDGVTYKVTKIGAKAFAQADRNGIMNDANGKPLYEDLSFTRVKLPATIVEIGDEAFCHLSTLKEFELPSKVEKIGKYAFYVSGVKNLTVPATCTTIGECAFGACGMETLVFAEGTKPLTLGRAAFIHNRLTAVTTPNRLAKWEASVFWSNPLLTDATVNGSVTSISESAFSDCGRLARVTVNAPVVSIGNQAFFNCYGLSSLKINGNTLRSIGESVFQHCAFTSLGPDQLPYGLTTIGKSAFHSCERLASVEFPVTLTKIVNNAFMGCKAITRVKCLTPIVPDAEQPTFDRSIFDRCDIDVLPHLAPKFRVATEWEWFKWGKYAEAAIDGVGTDADSADDAEYYDLNGVRMDAAPVAPGLYIERRGTTARKVIIR